MNGKIYGMYGKIYCEDFISRMQDRDGNCRISDNGLKDLFDHLESKTDKQGNPVSLALNDATVTELLHSWNHWEDVDDWFENSGLDFSDQLVEHDSYGCDEQGFSTGDPCPTEDGDKMHRDDIDSWENATWLVGSNQLIEETYGALEQVMITCTQPHCELSRCQDYIKYLASK